MLEDLGVNTEPFQSPVTETNVTLPEQMLQKLMNCCYELLYYCKEYDPTSIIIREIEKFLNTNFGRNLEQF